MNKKRNELVANVLFVLVIFFCGIVWGWAIFISYPSFNGGFKVKGEIDVVSLLSLMATIAVGFYVRNVLDKNDDTSGSLTALASNWIREALHEIKRYHTDVSIRRKLPASRANKFSKHILKYITLLNKCLQSMPGDFIYDDTFHKTFEEELNELQEMLTFYTDPIKTPNASVKFEDDTYYYTEDFIENLVDRFLNLENMIYEIQLGLAAA